MARRFHILLTSLLLWACPGYEDSYSGTWREADTVGEDDTPIAGTRAVDFFRMGHAIQAIVRFYAPADPETPAFSEELSCHRTSVDELGEDDSFEVLFEQGPSDNTRMAGRFETSERLVMRFNTRSEGNTDDIVFNRFGIEPSTVCDRIEPRRFDALFQGIAGPNEFEDGVYQIRDPWFGVQWVPVERIKSGSLEILTAPTPDLIGTQIPQHLTDNGRGLERDLSLFVEPPHEDDRVPSGQTRYSLAHFIVVDDDPEDNGLFSWDPNDQEPLIASGVRKGKRADQEVAVDHNRFGRAIFFVEGRLDELHEELLDDYLVGWEDVDPEAHFWVVDVFAMDDRVLKLRFEPDASRQIQVVVTPDFLDDTQLTLPRLFPTD